MKQMDDVRLPDLDRIDAVKKRLKKLPPQQSAADTSNWEQRGISVPVMDVKKKKTIVRELEFMRIKADDSDTLTLA
jgi:hypothetical protein